MRQNRLAALLTTMLCIAAGAADYVQDANCGLDNPAFMETFDQAYPGGYAADLDETKWTLSHCGHYPAGGYMTYFEADLPSVQTGQPATAWPGDELLVCDNTVPEYAGRLLAPNAGQNYGVTSMRVNQVFDFTGRTGRITCDATGHVEECTELPYNGHWVSVSITAEPRPTPNIPRPEYSNYPRNGVIIFLGRCASNGISMYLFDNYVETQVETIECPATALYHLNHYEVRISETSIEVWGADYTEYGTTFPNFRKVSEAAWSAPFSKGYVAFNVHNHATAKYGCPETAIEYWDNLA